MGHKLVLLVLSGKWLLIQIVMVRGAQSLGCSTPTATLIPGSGLTPFSTTTPTPGPIRNIK